MKELWKTVATIATLSFTFLMIRETQTLHWMMLLFTYCVISKIWDFSRSYQNKQETKQEYKNN